MTAKEPDLLQGSPYASGIGALVMMGGGEIIDDPVTLSALQPSELERLENIVNDPNHPWMKEYYRKISEQAERQREAFEKKQNDEERNHAKELISNWKNLPTRLGHIVLVDICGGALLGILLSTLLHSLNEIFWFTSSWPTHVALILGLTPIILVPLALFSRRVMDLRSAHKLLKESEQDLSDAEEE